MREIADTLKIPEGSVFTILHESLGIHKLFLKCAPRLLTPSQKQQNLDDLERCLELLKQGKKDFLRRYVTMDQTWIHRYIPETKISFFKWTAASETINRDYYMALLDRLSAEIKKKRLTCIREKCCFIKTMHRATSTWKRWSCWRKNW